MVLLVHEGGIWCLSFASLLWSNTMAPNIFLPTKQCIGKIIYVGAGFLTKRNAFTGYRQGSYRSCMSFSNVNLKKEKRRVGFTCKKHSNAQVSVCRIAYVNKRSCFLTFT